MSSISVQKSSSEGSSTLVDTSEFTPYLQTIFQESTTDSQKLDPQRYKVLKYEEDKANGVEDIIKEIDCIIEQQQSSSVFAGDIVIIIYDGITIEEDIFKHLEELDVRFTSLSGPGNCLILTMTRPPHERTAIFFIAVMHQIIGNFLDSVWEPIRDTILLKIRDHILNAFRNDRSQEEPQDQEALENGLRLQLQRLRQLLKTYIEVLMPELPEQPLDILNNALNEILIRIHSQSTLQLPSEDWQEDTLRSTLPSLLQQLQSEIPEPRKGLKELKERLLGPGQLIVPSGSFNMPLYIHSGRLICERLFGQNDVAAAISRLKTKKWNTATHGSKIPDYTIAPRYLSFVHSAHHRPFVPPVTVEVGLTDNRVKVLVDCIFTILGTRFQVDAMYGVDLHVNGAVKTLDSIDIYYFDVSMEALDDIWHGIRTEHDLARVSTVIGRKAQQKFNDLRTLELLREWERTGDNRGDQYQRVLERIGDLRCPYSLPYAPVPTDKQNRTSMPAALRTLQYYQRYSDETLRREMADYNRILIKCQNTVDRYRESQGAGTDIEQLTCEGEIILIQKIFEGKKKTHVDENTTESMGFPIKAFTGVELSTEKLIFLSPSQLQDCFSDIAMFFQETSVDNIEVCLPLPRESLSDCFQDVALINYPDFSPDEANAALEKDFEVSRDGIVLLRVKTRHVDIRAQLNDWDIEPEPTEYGNKILFIHECSKRYPNGNRQKSSVESLEILRDLYLPYRGMGIFGDNFNFNEPETSTADPVGQSSQEPLEPPQRNDSSLPNEPETSAADPVGQSSQEPLEPPQRNDSSLPNEPETSAEGPVGQSSQEPLEPPKRGNRLPSSSEGGTMTRTLKSGVETLRSGLGTIGRKVRKQSGTSKAKYTRSAAQDELPEEVSQCLNRLSHSKKARVRPYLMRDDVKSVLLDIEWTPAYLRAFEDFLSKKPYHIREVLARPRALKIILEDMAHEADNTQSPQSSQNSQNPNESENIGHEGSGQAN